MGDPAVLSEETEDDFEVSPEAAERIYRAHDFGDITRRPHYISLEGEFILMLSGDMVAVERWVTMHGVQVPKEKATFAIVSMDGGLMAYLVSPCMQVRH